jgi:RsiW-degrading membrane proteinase PrsW (M82 family)
MNKMLLFIYGLIFLTCFYGQSQLYAVNWFLVVGMLFSGVMITLLIGEE